MPQQDRQKMIKALETLQERGRKLLEGDVERDYKVWKTEVLTVARMVFGHDSPGYKDLDSGFWRYEEYIPAGCFKPKSDIPGAVRNVISILEGQIKALGYDLELG